jgi:hypothetical protein
MRVLYGQGQIWIDVTDKAIKDGWVSVDGAHNDLFGDPLIGIPKMVRIEDPALPQPLLFPENEIVRLRLVEASPYPERFYRIELNPHRSCGLCNQLFAIASALVIGSETGRAIAVKGFSPDYNSSETIDIGDVLDLDATNRALERFRVRLVSISDLPQVTWKRSKARIIVGEEITPYQFIDRARSEDDKHLDLGCTFELGIFAGSPDERYRALHEKIMFSFQYLPDYHLPIEGDYCAVHLRLEDDMLDHIKSYRPDFDEDAYVKEAVDRYIKEIGGSKAYLATGLTKYPNRHNWVVDKLRQYGEVVLSQPLGRGRELDALVDLIACMNGRSFIGKGGSTFSAFLVIYHTAMGRRAINF